MFCICYAYIVYTELFLYTYSMIQKPRTCFYFNVGKDQSVQIDVRIPFYHFDIPFG